MGSILAMIMKDDGLDLSLQATQIRYGVLETLHEEVTDVMALIIHICTVIMLLQSPQWVPYVPVYYASSVINERKH